MEFEETDTEIDYIIRTDIESKYLSKYTKRTFDSKYECALYDKFLKRMLSLLYMYKPTFENNDITKKEFTLILNVLWDTRESLRLILEEERQYNLKMMKR